MVGHKIASILLLFVGSAFCGVIAARQDVDPQANPALPWPISYIALGDSFAAGIGAGKYTNANDKEVKRCKRFDGSYPSQAKKLFPHVDDPHFTFEACSGDVLGGIDAQVQKLGGQRAQVVTLSISGNDFLFGNVVKNCVYSVKAGDNDKDSGCDKALAGAEQKINDNAVWASYKEKVEKILKDVATQDHFLIKWGVLVITGYAKFFGDASEGDTCSNFRFPIAPLISGNKLRAQVRTKMNSLVDMVNRRISSEIVGVSPTRIKFVNIDDHFRGHRFCDNGKTDGANDPDVWFISLGTNLEESSFTPDGNSALEQAWADWDDGSGNLLPGKLRQSSCFHPKTPGHAETAKKVQSAVQNWGSENGHNQGPPPRQCYPTDAGDIPRGIISVTNPKQVNDPNGLLFRLREVLCHNQCKIPDGIDPQAGVVVSGDNGRCDIAIGVQGGSEAYAVRDRSISGNDQTQHCWDTLENIINKCVNNGPNHGWQNGVDPNPAFYQTGYRKLNDPGAHHPTIPGDRVLEKDLSDFQSGCGGGRKWCQADGCTGNWYLCTDGAYKGCKCLSDSRFGSIPIENFDYKCQNDCCNTKPQTWYRDIWCPANCGGIARQFC